MESFNSHPNKKLSLHVNGITDIKNRRASDYKHIDDIITYHDTGKVNPHFQNKLKGILSGYSNHALLSSYIFFLNKNNIISDLDMSICLNIINNHHTDLKNMDRVISIENNNDIHELNQVLCDNQISLIINGEKTQVENSNLLRNRFNIKDKSFEKINSYFKIQDWSTNSIQNYYDTLYNYGLLCDSDIREASSNFTINCDSVDYDMDDFREKFTKYLDGFKPSLIRSIFTNFSNDKNITLNKIRTEIRVGILDKLYNELKTSNTRVFSVYSPTGSGKEIIMYSIADLINKTKGNYGIVYTLPYLSIIDQVYNNLTTKINCGASIFTSNDKFSNLSVFTEEEMMNDVSELLNNDYSNNTLDNNIIVTTFNQLFETLISNKKKDLIKLPNLTRKIFLIDEYQNVPPNLYIFFAGILQEFCEKHDSYAILSSATLPNFDLNNHPINSNFITPSDVLKNYKKPFELSDSSYFKNDIFNRYVINYIGEKNNEDLMGYVEQYKGIKSTLVMFNRIRTSIEFYNSLEYDNKYLLNSNFTHEDKIRIISSIKNDIKNGKKPILISTQVIEAGVDLSFEVLFRDYAPLISIIQSCGRLNRNFEYIIGECFIFKSYHIAKNNNKYFSCKIYGDSNIDFILPFLEKPLYEKELFDIQKKLFESISKDKVIGKDGDSNLLSNIYYGKIKDNGDYKLIKEVCGVYTYYVGEDELWNSVRNEIFKLNNSISNTLEEKKIKTINITSELKKLSNHTVSYKAYDENIFPPFEKGYGELCYLKKLLEKRYYTHETGLIYYGDDTFS